MSGVTWKEREIEKKIQWYDNDQSYDKSNVWVISLCLHNVGYCILTSTGSRIIFYRSLLQDIVTFIWSVFINHHHHHVALSALTFLTLSCHPSLSSIAPGRSSGLHPVSSQSYCMYVCMFQLDVLPLLVPVKGSTGVYHLWVRANFSSSDSFRDGWQVAVQLLFCGVLSLGLFNTARSILV